MSKIEDALKKARDANIVGFRPANTRAGHQDARSLVVSENGSSSVDRESSSKQIALIDDGEILDNKKLSELKVIYSEMKDHKLANTYRDIRTQLIQKSAGKNFIGMVTSCVSGSHSSTTALNLATAFSFDESKTSLLIDCNLNASRLNSMLDIESDIGLTDFLENENISVESILKKTGIKRLKMIPAGSSRETAVEYFTSLKMRNLINDLLQRYSDRYIFIDSAPITESADTRILAELCDFVLLVVPYGQVTKSRIKEAADAIGEEKLLGVIFSDIPRFPSIRIPGFSSPR